MTPFVLRHYDAFRSPLLVTCFPQIVILNGGKNALWEKRETGQWHRVKNLLPGWRLTGFLTTAADPSHSFRMTFYGLLHHDSEPSSSLRVIPDRPPSFWTEARMPCGKNGKRNDETEWRIYYADDALPLFLITVIDPSRSLWMTINISLTTTANPLLMFRMTPNGNHMLRLLTHS